MNGSTLEDESDIRRKKQSRFFYCAKSSSSERNRGLDKPSSHPTVKPITVPGSPTCLDPFAGSGSTLVASKELGINCIGIEMQEEYCEIARKRVESAKHEEKPRYEQMEFQECCM